MIKTKLLYLMQNLKSVIQDLPYLHGQIHIIFPMTILTIKYNLILY